MPNVCVCSGENLISPYCRPNGVNNGLWKVRLYFVRVDGKWSLLKSLLSVKARCDKNFLYLCIPRQFFVRLFLYLVGALQEF